MARMLISNRRIIHLPVGPQFNYVRTHCHGDILIGMFIDIPVAPSMNRDFTSGYEKALTVNRDLCLER